MKIITSFLKGSHCVYIVDENILVHCNSCFRRRVFHQTFAGKKILKSRFEIFDNVLMQAKISHTSTF